MIRKLKIFFCVLWLVAFPAGVTAVSHGQVAVATAHPLATRAGIEILQSGGNAFDAAVAVSAVLAVVEPYSSGLGGGGFWLLHRENDKFQIMVDGREEAPGRATDHMYLDKHGEPVAGLSLNGALAAGIPGLPAGLVHLTKRYGKLTLRQNLAPAIRYAREGFPVTEHYRRMASYRLEVLRRYPDAAGVFLVNNEIPPTGHLIVQPDLAQTLELIVHQGMGGFYLGQTANKLVNGVADAGGIWSTADLAAYQVVERHPIITHFHNLRIISAPPPSSGGIVLAEMLNMLEHFDLATLDDVTRKHIIAESMRRAYRDRAAYLGDPDHVQIDIDRLLDQEYLEGLAITIDPERATSSEEIGGIAALPGVGEDTTHFSIMDGEGNRVSATLSINLPFGSGFMPPGTGVILNNEMDDFSTKPLVPNAYGLVGDEANSIAPGKRPLSSMTPTFVESRESVGILGTPGGSRIISMVLLGILELVENKPPRSWVSAPRFHHQYLPDEIQFEEGGLTHLEQSGLRRLGHQLKEIKRQYGNMQAILWYIPRQIVLAASDPRGEGEAIVTTLKK